MSVSNSNTGRIFMTGGTGFVGANIRGALGDRPLRLLVRPGSQQPVVSGDVEIVEGDVTKPETLVGKIDGCDTVIHLVAIIEEEGGATFDGVIRQGTVNVIKESKKAGVSRFILMSALGTHNNPTYPYFQAKYLAEQAIKESGLAYSIVRPSIVFGPGDLFVNTLANLIRKAPVLPVVGDGQSKFQPVHVKDVASVFATLANDPSKDGETYELGGTKIVTYEEMMEIVAGQLGKKPRKVHVPIGLMKGVVTLTSPLPKSLRPPVNMEQLRMLAIDNATQHSATKELIGREPIGFAEGIDYIS